MYTCFQITTEANIAHVRMTRGEQHNSMNAAFWKELPVVMDEVEANPAVRVVVLSADGKSFSSGMDLSIFAKESLLATETTVQRERLRRLVLHLQSVLNRIDRCRVPVIAAIQGACIGGGLDLAAACDLRYASANASFTIHEINLGMMADLGTLQRLPRLMPEALVRELALTGDKLSAEKARAAGFINDVLADDTTLLQHATTIADKIAARSPMAILATREALRYARSHAVEDALEMAATWQAAIFSSADVTSAVKAQKSGGAAQYADPDTSAFDL
jgi:enoyl-CoA hydratase